MEHGIPAPGFFGKLPSHGDFVGRGLPPAVRDCFDRWLQEALLRSREALGAAWLPAWMNGPLWRFALPAGTCGPQAWAGVMMPSHDRVGRCFPLLLAAGLRHAPALEDCLNAHDAWFARLEDLALSVLEPGSDAAELEAALQAMPEAGGAPRTSHRAAANAWTDAVAGQGLEGGATGGRSAWWTEGGAHLPPALATCAGLPPGKAFAAFLDGRWQAHGWYPLAPP